MHIPLAKIQAGLPLPATPKWPQGVWDLKAFAHGSMSLVLFTPRGRDYQTTHEQDELYFVHRGSGTLVIDGKRFPFQPGDALFVPARVEHHFEDFGDDLVTWGVFWGPDGGE